MNIYIYIYTIWVRGPLGEAYGKPLFLPVPLTHNGAAGRNNYAPVAIGHSSS